jgi:predicted alpha/beta superfamily hydrolase
MKYAAVNTYSACRDQNQPVDWQIVQISEASNDVLYMHDGDSLFDATLTMTRNEWQVDEIAGTLIDSVKVRPFTFLR